MTKQTLTLIVDTVSANKNQSAVRLVEPVPAPEPGKTSALPGYTVQINYRDQTGTTFAPGASVTLTIDEPAPVS